MVGQEVSFQWKNPDFLFKNPDFLLKNVDFILFKKGRALVDGVPVNVGDTHLELTRTLRPLSACVVTIAPHS